MDEIKNDPHGDNDRIATLIADLSSLAAGWRPAEEELAHSPILENWSWTFYPGTEELALTGAVSGHPLLGDRSITTSPIFAIGLTGRWARSQNRFYRLGKPLLHG